MIHDLLRLLEKVVEVKEYDVFATVPEGTP